MRLLNRTPFREFAAAVQVLRQGRRWDAPAWRAAQNFKPELVLTVAHGDGCHAAARLAKRTQLPLVTFFHDWWPDLVPRWLRADEELQFRRLYATSHVAFCVCNGMRQALGDHPNAPILSPIPGAVMEGRCGRTNARQVSPFNVFYSGNLREYGPMLQDALQTLQSEHHVRLEVRGMSPQWPAAFLKEMAAAGLYHEFAPRPELEKWLEEADAFLIAMSFEPAMRQMMMTCFPSKLLEFAQFAKPLVIWGPEYSTAIRWGRENDRALCVKERNPHALKDALVKLSRQREEQRRLAKQALEAAQTEFDHVTIHETFLRAIEKVIQRSEEVLARS
jgi:hypothetical protein